MTHLWLPSCVRGDGLEALRVLVVEDEQRLASIVVSYLEHEGYEVRTSHDGITAVETAATFMPDFVILDVMLPGLDGMEVCRQLRGSSDCYIVMLTAREEEVDKVLALSLGADDYLVKPFSPRELIARVKAMLRRPRTNALRNDKRTIEIGSLSIDTEARVVSVGGRAVNLTRTEYQILMILAARPRAVVTRRQLIDGVWGSDMYGDDHVVDVHVGNLRRKLGDTAEESRFVRTVRGVGYGMGSA